ncbi:alanine acetyltransferase [Lysobacter arvi]|uniref:Alanine acetyltransferase n=1 Tax=Lysobacter arvi TaxID=3038776 RepID=A0ABU1CF84_9GAMM|nr:alanine acetyltransferase [Lysobacter arvi]MDR0183610.1 alanine acetyltransferase [Lysobacter arvi]
MSELWTAEQREWLEAMGHTVWSIAPADALAAERQPDGFHARGDDDAPAPSGPRNAMREAAALLARDDRPSRPAPTRPAATPASLRGQGDRLLHAVLRAAGGADETRVMALVGDVAALRGNAAAKRALWPRLRALRRTSRE